MNADQARKARAGWRALTIAAGLFLPPAAVLVLMFAVFGSAAVAALGGLVVLGPAIATVVLASRRAKARAAEVGRALDEAWLAAARDVARTGPTDAARLRAAFAIDEAHAEQLAALLDLEPAVVRARFVDAVPAEAPVDQAEAETEAQAVDEQERLARSRAGTS